MFGGERRRFSLPCYDLDGNCPLARIAQLGCATESRIKEARGQRLDSSSLTGASGEDCEDSSRKTGVAKLGPVMKDGGKLQSVGGFTSCLRMSIFSCVTRKDGPLITGLSVILGQFLLCATLSSSKDGMKQNIQKSLFF